MTEEHLLESHLATVCQVDTCSAPGSWSRCFSPGSENVTVLHYVLENNVPERFVFCSIQSYASEVKKQAQLSQISLSDPFGFLSRTVQPCWGQFLFALSHLDERKAHVLPKCICMQHQSSPRHQIYTPVWSYLVHLSEGRLTYLRKWGITSDMFKEWGRTHK